MDDRKIRKKAEITFPFPPHLSYFKTLFLLTSIIFIAACPVKEPEPEENKFERQATSASTDLMAAGDTLNFWGADTPSAAVFVLTQKRRFLKAVGLKPEKLEEMDKTIDELNKTISSEPIYQLEVYELSINAYDPKNPDICSKINQGFNNGKLLFITSGISLRVKERNWVDVNTRINPDKLTIVRVGVAESYSVIRNNATDAFYMNTVKAQKSWSSFTIAEKQQINAWACQEAVFFEERRLEPLYYNPDVVFYYE